MKKNPVDFYVYPGTPTETDTPELNHTCIALHKLVNQVIAGFSIRSVQQAKLIANNVQQDMLVSTDKDMLATILNHLLSSTLLYGQNNIIQLSAKLISNISLIHIKTGNTVYVDAMADTVHKFQPLAAKLGGCLTMSHTKNHGIALAFTFINQ